MLSNFSSIFEIIVGFSFAVGIDAINKIIFKPVTVTVSKAYLELSEITKKCQFAIVRVSKNLKEVENQFENAKKYIKLTDLLKKNENDTKKIYEILKSKLDSSFFENIFFINGLLFIIILLLIGFENKHPVFCFQITFIITFSNILFYGIQFFIYYKQIKFFEFVKIPFLNLLLSYLILFLGITFLFFINNHSWIVFVILTISSKEIVIFVLIISSFFPYLLLKYISYKTISKINQTKFEYFNELQNIDIDLINNSIDASSILN